MSYIHCGLFVDRSVRKGCLVLKRLFQRVFLKDFSQRYSFILYN